MESGREDGGGGDFFFFLPAKARPAAVDHQFGSLSVDSAAAWADLELPSDADPDSTWRLFPGGY